MVSEVIESDQKPLESIFKKNILKVLPRLQKILITLTELIIADFLNNNKLVIEIRKKIIDDNIDIKNVLLENLGIRIIDKIKQETKVDETSNLLKNYILN